MREKSFVESFTKHRLGMIGLAGIVIIIVLGAFGPLIVSYPVGYNEVTPLVAPDREHWLGTDGLGLDLIAEIVWGARTSLFISFTAVAVATCIGVPLGLVSGYFRGRTGGLIDSVIEIAMTIPALPLMILISAISGPSMGTVAVVIGLFSWPTLARINATPRSNWPACPLLRRPSCWAFRRAPSCSSTYCSMPPGRPWST